MNVDGIMLEDGILLEDEEKAIFKLRSIFSEHGYLPYKMNKFEEYDLYVRNKDFLISDSIITFTDMNGRLMALKPDVTLSIIKNSEDRPDRVRKVYYNENVYRVDKGTQAFKEIMQVGLECVGAVDDYQIFEVLLLAAKSLQTISDDCVLDISHLGILSDVLELCEVPENIQKEVVHCIGEKNIHGLELVCRQAGVDEEKIGFLGNMVSTYGKPADVLSGLKQLTEKAAEDNSYTSGLIDDINAKIDNLEAILNAFPDGALKDMLRIDFSVISDINYYNGIVFKGFVQGIPEGILSGGQYDKLMKKMKRKSGAIGFAVYMDLLERFVESENRFDVDVVLLYDESFAGPDKLEVLAGAMAELSKDGAGVMVQREVPDKIKYRRLVKIDERGVTEIENNA